MPQGVAFRTVIELAAIGAVVMLFWTHPVLKPWLGGLFMALGIVQLIRVGVTALVLRTPPVRRWSALSAAMSCVGLMLLGAGQLWSDRTLEVTGLIVAFVPIGLARLVSAEHAANTRGI
jgi:hypothetical protein